MNSFFRLLHACVSNTETRDKWIAAIQRSSVFNNLVFILENSLNGRITKNFFSVVLPLDIRTATSDWYVKRCSFVTSTLTYNFRNTVATDIKYVLVESFESAECFWKVLNSMSM